MCSLASTAWCRPSLQRHQAPGELVDDDDFAFLHHVLHVEVEQAVRPQRLVDVVLDVRVLEVVDVPAVQMAEQHLLGLQRAALGQRHRLVLLVDDVVAGGLEGFALFGLRVAAYDGPGFEPRDDAIDLVVEVGGHLRRSRNDERRPGFVDEDAVDLVDDGEVMPALHVVRELELHVVSQVVEAELVVGPVGDVRVVRNLPFVVAQVVLDDADAHAQEAVDAPHPLGVAARQVVVHRHDVDAFAFERVQVGRQRRDERLAFARLHLGDLALMQNGAADQLDVEVPHVQHAAADLAHDREGLGQEVVERLAVGEALLELGGLAAKLIVRERLHRGLERVDLRDERAQLLQFTFVLGADDLREDLLDHLLEAIPRGDSNDCNSYCGSAETRHYLPGCRRGGARLSRL